MLRGMRDAAGDSGEFYTPGDAVPPQPVRTGKSSFRTGNLTGPTSKNINVIEAAHGFTAPAPHGPSPPRQIWLLILILSLIFPFFHFAH